MNYSEHRPKGCERQGDLHPSKIVQRLRQVLAETQHEFAHVALHLDDDDLGDLAGILVDFAEDLHAGTGIWAAYERYNVDFFGTALPLTSAGSTSGLSTDRFRHFLWVLYPVLLDGLTLSPTHQDLRLVADAASSFLADAFAEVPKDSGVKGFLGTPNDHGWDVKRKLVWLGTHSFLFRTMFDRYIDEEAQGKADIDRTDDFICQHCTRWTGLPSSAFDRRPTVEPLPIVRHRGSQPTLIFAFAGAG
jgi:hypothetical protein